MKKQINSLIDLVSKKLINFRDDQCCEEDQLENVNIDEHDATLAEVMLDKQTTEEEVADDLIDHDEIQN